MFTPTSRLPIVSKNWRIIQSILYRCLTIQTDCWELSRRKISSRRQMMKWARIMQSLVVFLQRRILTSLCCRVWKRDCRGSLCCWDLAWWCQQWWERLRKLLHSSLLLWRFNRWYLTWQEMLVHNPLQWLSVCLQTEALLQSRSFTLCQKKCELDF